MTTIRYRPLAGRGDDGRHRPDARGPAIRRHGWRFAAAIMLLAALLHLEASALTQSAIVVVGVALERPAAKRGGPGAAWTVGLTAAIWVIGGLGRLVSYPLGWVGAAQRVRLLTLTAGTVAGAAWLFSPGLCARHTDRADRETSIDGNTAGARR